MDTMDFPDFNSSTAPLMKSGLSFEEKYVDMRHREQWLSPDAEVGLLPDVSTQHPHYREWCARKRSGSRLLHYLKKKQAPLNILEVGCGNGWLSNLLSSLPYSRVTGIDINTTELMQARRVFVYSSNLEFILGDIRSGILFDRRFDMVVFAASIQYFPCMQTITQFVLEHLLTHTGEIHILDTPFYKAEEVAAARERTAAYYAKLGFPEMTGYYFHHSMDDLQPFHYKILYQPMAVQHRFTRNRNPFCWIRIKNT